MQAKYIKLTWLYNSVGGGFVKFIGAKTCLGGGKDMNTLGTYDMDKSLNTNKKSKANATDNTDLQNNL